MRQFNSVSDATLEQLGWPQILITDYQGRLDALTPQNGTDADPNGIYAANLNGFYVDTNTPGMWYNPTPGDDTGWIQLV